MVPVLRRAVVALILSLPAAPAVAQSLSAIAEAEHKIYRDRIVRLYEDLAEIPDDAPMASAQRLHVLAQVGFWHDAIMNWPAGMAHPTDVRRVLTTDPARAVPALAVPLADQVAAELEKVVAAGKDCLAAPTTECLTDVAAGYAAASTRMEAAQTRHLRLVQVARLSGDAARLGILHRMASEELPLFARGIDLGGSEAKGREFHGLAMRAHLFRLAGFEDEAHELARRLGSKWRLRPGDPRATFAKLLIDEHNWRQGRMSATELFAEAQYFIDGDEGKAEVIQRMVPNLMLVIGKAVEDDAAFQARALARIHGLPAADVHQTAATLTITLGRLGHADLLAQFPPSRVEEMLAEPKPGDSALQTAAALGFRMVAAAWLGRGDVAGPYRQRLIDLLTRLPPPSPDPKLDEAGQTSLGFAHLAEVQAMLAQ